MTRNMIISDTKFPHKSIHKQTKVSPSGQTKNQIDHVIVDKRARRWITDIRSMRGCSAISDYFLIKIQVQIRISVEKQKRTALPKRMNTETLMNHTIEGQYKKKSSKSIAINKRIRQARRNLKHYSKYN